MIGAVILKGEGAYDQAAVEPDDVYDLRHKSIWEAMGELRNAGQPPGDVQLIAELLGERIDAVGGIAYLAKTTESTVPDHVPEYSRLIRTAALTRRVQGTLAELAASSLEGSELLAQVLERAQSLARHVEDPTRAMPEIVKAAMLSLSDALRRKEEGQTVWGVETGYPELDKILAGVQRGKVSILAARPSMGKSAMARSIAAHVVKSGQGGAHVFTPEDTAETYALRQLSDDSRVALERFRTLKLKAKELAPIQYAANRLRERRLWLIDETAGISTSDIALRTRKHIVENETALIVVDYAQLLTERDIPLSDPVLQLTMISRRLIGVAKNHNVAVLLLSQLSRACEKREDKRPLLSDLRESGALEQDAEAVVVLYRDEMYNEHTEDAGITEAIIRKNKNGPTGTVRLTWDAKTATHRSLSTRTDEPAQRSFS
jgi:replicative DNA helicase